MYAHLHKNIKKTDLLGKLKVISEKGSPERCLRIKS